MQLQLRQSLIFFGLATLLAFAAACQPTSAAEPETAVVQSDPQTPVQQTGGPTVQAEGQIVPRFFTTLSFQSGGTVADLLVENGQRVAAGDELVRLDDVQQRLGLAQAEAQRTAAQTGLTAAQNQLALAQAGVTSAEGSLAAAQANLTLTLAGPRPVELAQVQSQVAAAQAGVVRAAGNRDAALDIATDSSVQAAQAELSAATAALRGLEEAYQDILDACFDTPDGEVCPLYGPVEENTRAQLEVAQANQQAAQAALDSLLAGPTAAQQQAANSGVSAAQAQLNLAEAQLLQLEEGATAEQVEAAEVAVSQAQVNVTIAQANVAQAEAAVSQAEAAVSQAETAVLAAQTALDRTVLRAPIDGVVSQITINQGELVSSGIPVLTVADLSEWHVQTTDLTELDVALVQPGDAVTVQIDAIPEAAVSGEVTEVALISAVARGDVVYETTIRLDEAPDLPLRWGMTVFVSINVR